MKFFLCLQATSDCVKCMCNGSLVNRSLRQRGQENQVINTPQLSVCIVMEGEIVDVNVILKQVVRQQFSRTSSGIAFGISRGLGSYFNTGLSFAGLIWLVVGNSEGKKFLAIKNYLEPRDLLDA